MWRPRSSENFTYEGTEVDKKAKPEILFLFTGSDNSTGIVKHMGIITAGGEVPQFIQLAR
jgi:hypothetical protein